MPYSIAAVLVRAMEQPKFRRSELDYTPCNLAADLRGLGRHYVMAVCQTPAPAWSLFTMRGACPCSRVLIQAVLYKTACGWRRGAWDLG